MEKEKKNEDEIHSKESKVKNYQQVVELLQKYECNKPMSKGKLMKKKYWTKSKAF